MSEEVSKKISGDSISMCETCHKPWIRKFFEDKFTDVTTHDCPIKDKDKDTKYGWFGVTRKEPGFNCMKVNGEIKDIGMYLIEKGIRNEYDKYIKPFEKKEEEHRVFIMNCQNNLFSVIKYALIIGVPVLFTYLFMKFK